MKKKVSVSQVKKIFKKILRKKSKNTYQLLFINSKKIKFFLHRFLVDNVFFGKQRKTLFSETKGQVYDLEKIYRKINERYFDSRVRLPIMWFGNAQRAVRCSRTLGYYDEEEQVIKIHRLLDNAYFPTYYIDFIIYHEMLHTICPPYYSKAGKYLTHHKKFKEREKEFRQYHLAIEWEEKHLDAFFVLKKG